MIRIYKAITVLLVTIFPWMSVFSAETPITILKNMRQAVTTLDYEMGYIEVTRKGVHSLRYSHAHIGNDVVAQLDYLDGKKRKVVLKKNQVGYFFDNPSESFSIPARHILEGLPRIVFTNINELSKRYNIHLIGQERIFDKNAYVVAVAAKDKLRYSYKVWIDSETFLPLQSDLFDEQPSVFERFKVVHLVVGEASKERLEFVANLEFPSLLTLEKQASPKDQNVVNWSHHWLPESFSLVKNSRRYLDSIYSYNSSRFYSDGLFNFTINVIPAEQSKTKEYLSNSNRTVYSETRSGYEIIVMGYIPLETAKRVANSVTFDAIQN